MDPLEALGALSLDWAPTPDDVWRPSPFHVDGLHSHIGRRIVTGIEAARTGTSNPIGIAIEGQRGAGKTHLLGWVREQAQQRDGYFFLVTLHDGVDFWSSTLHCFLDGLTRVPNGCDSQLTAFLRRLAGQLGFSTEQQRAIAGDMRISPESMDIFVSAFRSSCPQLGAECHDTVRALVLRAARDTHAQDVGYAYLQGREETEPGERAAWHIQHRDRKPAQWLVRELSRLLALTGPTVIAVDQIDALVARYGGGLVNRTEAAVPSDRQLDMVAAGLMDLREVTTRTLCVVACLPQSWALIRGSAVNTAADRFRNVLHLRRIPSGQVAEELIAKRLAEPYEKIGFEPPYPTWPIKPSAFEDAPAYTPRALIQRVDSHITACLNDGIVRELERLDEDDEGTLIPPPPPPPPAAVTQLSILDARFAEYCSQADVAAGVDPATEDAAMPRLISAGLAAWIEERGQAAHLYSQNGLPRGSSTLHGRLRRTLNEETEDEIHWGFRAIAHPNARAALVRLQAACGFAGLRENGSKRRLFILRNADWSRGEKTQAALAQLSQSGGRTLPISPDDLAVFDALHRMRSDGDPAFSAWLRSRQPAGRTNLLREALSDEADANPAAEGVPTDGPTGATAVPGEASTADQPTAGDEPAAPGEQSAVDGPADPAPAVGDMRLDDPLAVPWGVDAESGESVITPLEALRKHTAIFAGSGSGKTVLIRRLVEECALRGVSSIVLDPNNDLARLGDPWPEPPPGWGAGDQRRAEQYLAGTEVVVWTPRRAVGRPLILQPLPDLASVRDDPDELANAIDAAVATLAPKAKVDGRTVKAERGQAVLRQTLEYFARHTSGDLRAYVRFLSDLPDGVSTLATAPKLANDLAQTLTAAMVNDPLLGGAGTPVDPGVLLTPAPGKRARVSVISFVGLPSDEQRQSFANALQMALFSWVKRHPARDRPLGGLFVMDEAQALAPSGPMTACTQSTIALASQARKYGLGLVFATQAPKGLHNRIPGNAATQLFGFLNSPVQIAAAREMAQAKGSAVPDISRLRTGDFYLAAEGQAFQRIRTTICLSHHPKSPLTNEEVLSRARS